MWSPSREILSSRPRAALTRVYQWTHDDDEVAFDAIIVGIACDEAALQMAGLTVPEPVAAIYWPDWISQGEKIKATLEGPYQVEEALRRADSLCYLWAYNRVVISIQHRSLWRDAWGTLAAEPGFDNDDVWPLHS